MRKISADYANISYSSFFSLSNSKTWFEIVVPTIIHTFRGLFSLCTTGALAYSTFSFLDRNNNVYNHPSHWVIRGLYFLAIPHLITVLYTLFPQIMYCNKSEVYSTQRIIFRWVSRGDNEFRLKESINKTRLALSNIPTSNYRLEAVTEIPVSGLMENGVINIVVPGDYEITKKYADKTTETKYKARALNYANDQSYYDSNEWILHLDEESYVPRETVVYLYNWVSPTKTNQIGQGVILYDSSHYRTFSQFLTNLADGIRVTDDFGKFRLQAHLGYPIFGMKGSFWIIQAAQEKSIGFNYGYYINITEDALFALIAWYNGIRMSFLPCYIYEQSPYTIVEFIKQRGRWLSGLNRVIRCPQVLLRQRFVLGFVITLWSLSILTYIPLILNFTFNFPDNDVYDFGLMSVFALFIHSYLFGSLTNNGFDWRSIFSIVFSVIPVYPFLELCGVFYGLYRLWTDKDDFEVIDKN